MDVQQRNRMSESPSRSPTNLRPAFAWPSPASHNRPVRPTVNADVDDDAESSSLGKRRRGTQMLSPASTTGLSPRSSRSSSFSSMSSTFSFSPSSSVSLSPSSHLPPLHNRRPSIDDLLNPEDSGTTPPAALQHRTSRNYSSGSGSGAGVYPRERRESEETSSGWRHTARVLESSNNSNYNHSDAEPVLPERGRSNPQYPPLPTHFKLPSLKKLKISATVDGDDDDRVTVTTRCRPLPPSRRFSDHINFVGPAISRTGRRAAERRKSTLPKVPAGDGPYYDSETSD